MRAWIKWILEQFHLAIDPKLGAACKPIAAKLRNGAVQQERIKRISLALFDLEKAVSFRRPGTATASAYHMRTLYLLDWEP